MRQEPNLRFRCPQMSQPAARRERQPELLHNFLKSQTKPVFFQDSCLFPYCLAADKTENNFRIQPYPLMVSLGNSGRKE